MYGGLRAVGEKPDLALVACDVDAESAGTLKFWHLFLQLMFVFNNHLPLSN